MATTEFVKPNLYQLSAPGIHVTYATTGFDGKAHFTYQDHRGTHTFSGDQINTVATHLGTLVTVRIQMTIDSGSTDFSVFIPTVNLDPGPGQSAPVHTFGATTVHRFSILHALNHGQVDSYNVVHLSGTGRFVVF